MSSLAAEVPSWRALRVPDPDAVGRLGGVDCVVVVGASGTGKTTLVDAVRAAALPGIEVPVRFVTRPRRTNDNDAENVHLARDEFERAVAGGSIGLHWVRRMEDGREERYGFAPAPRGKLVVYSANNAFPFELAGAHALILGVYAPDALRAQRLEGRSPDLSPHELAHRLADRAANVLSRVHVVVENHGVLEEAAKAETIQLVTRLAAEARARCP